MSPPRSSNGVLEIKRSLPPKLQPRFYRAIEDIRPQRRIVVNPGAEKFPMRDGVENIPIAHVARVLAGIERE